MTPPPTPPAATRRETPKRYYNTEGGINECYPDTDPNENDLVGWMDYESVLSELLDTQAKLAAALADTRRVQQAAVELLESAMGGRPSYDCLMVSMQKAKALKTTLAAMSAQH